MKIKNILYAFLWTNIIMFSNIGAMDFFYANFYAMDINAMEQPNVQQQPEQLSRRVYPSNLPLLLWCGCLKNEESCLSMLPNELIVEIIKHIRKILKDQDLLNILNADLLKAVKASNKNEVKRLLNEPYIDANIKGEYGKTPLILAIENSSPDGGVEELLQRFRVTEIVKMLLDKGANPDIQDKWGNTALMWAAVKNNPETVQLLLDAGANPDIQDNDGWTALYFVKRLGYIGIIEILEAGKPQTKTNCIIA